MKYYLAIDIGASSGRHILGSVKDGRITTEEVYRFKNNIYNNAGQTCWDIENLFFHIKKGMKRCADINKIPVSTGIDTWGVDFVLLDENGRIIGNTVSYRDKRTKGMDSLVFEKISMKELYGRTGIQKQIFNTVYQLTAIGNLKNAETFLMIPDYLHFLLTEIKSNEYTNGTTTNLVNAEKKEWDYELIERLGFKKNIFLPLSKPGTVLGKLSDAVAGEIGFSCEVVLPPTHDTASAVLAVPYAAQDNDYIYLSSGTWSLMGTESIKPDCSAKSMENNFTNEGGYDYRYRHLKNIMGLWIIQSIKKELECESENIITYDDFCKAASEADDFPSLIDVDDNSFLAPDSMINAVRDYCKSSGSQVPYSLSELCVCIYKSLANAYKKTVSEIECINGVKYSKIHVIGGGSSDIYLNRLIAEYTGKTVVAGPKEATAIGNLISQMIKNKEFGDVYSARKSVSESFNLEIY